MVTVILVLIGAWLLGLSLRLVFDRSYRRRFFCMHYYVRTGYIFTSDGRGDWGCEAYRCVRCGKERIFDVRNPPINYIYR